MNILYEILLMTTIILVGGCLNAVLFVLTFNTIKKKNSDLQPRFCHDCNRMHNFDALPTMY